MSKPNCPNILIAIQHYLPGTNSGGPVRTIANLVELLGDDFCFSILTLDRDHKDASAYPEITRGQWYPVGKAQVRYLDRSELKPWNLRRILANVDYEMLYINGAFTSIALSLLFLKRLHMMRQAPILLAPRGHLEQGALSFKPLKKRVFLQAAKLCGLYEDISWHAASDNEEDDILHEFGNARYRQIRVIPNLVTLTPDVSHIERRVKTPGRLKVVFLSRLLRMKNLLFALHIIKGIHADIELDIYGPTEDFEYWNECQAAIANLPPNIVATYRGSAAQASVSEVLAKYHLFILPTYGENFGHVILEALSVGCPVLISDRTPWNRVQECGAGWALPLDKPDQFRAVVQQMVDADAATWAAYSERARSFAADYIANSSAVEDMRRFLMEVATAKAYAPQQNGAPPPPP